MIAQTHLMKRTSKKGERFVGRCVNCGAAGLTLKDVDAHCPNTLKATDEQNVIAAIEDKRS